MKDSNYPPGDFAGLDNEVIGPLVLAPEDGGRAYDDVWKVSNCNGCAFTGIEVQAGAQRENAQDLNRESCGNTFTGSTLDAGGQGAILVKGGSSGNHWRDTVIRNAGGHTDVMIGGFSGQSRDASKGNSFDYIRRKDGKPVRYAYTFTRAERPTFTNSAVEFQFWWSLVRTIHQEWCYFPMKTEIKSVIVIAAVLMLSACASAPRSSAPVPASSTAPVAAR